MLTQVELISPNKEIAPVIVAGDNANQDGIALEPGKQGWYDAKTSARTRNPAQRHGQQFLGFRYEPRDIVLKLLISNDGPNGGQQFRDREALARALFAFDDYTTIRVTTDTTVRTMQVRLVEFDLDTEIDPNVAEATSLIVTCVADDPFWYGPEFTKEFRQDRGGAATFWEVTLPKDRLGEVESYPRLAIVSAQGGSWPIIKIPREANRGSSPRVTLPQPTGTQRVKMFVNYDPGSRQVEDEYNTLIWAAMNGVRFGGGIRAGKTHEVFRMNVDIPSGAALRITFSFSPRYNTPW